ncbi:MAG: hypothetical protein ACYTEZ_08585 [Planctomycetota bacterium]|jgi:hypothetical protein
MNRIIATLLLGLVAFAEGPPLSKLGDDALAERWKALEKARESDDLSYEQESEREAVLCEFVRRGGDRWVRELAPLARAPADLRVLTALRRLQKRPDPVRIDVAGPRFECVFPDLPTVRVELRVIDELPVTVQQGGNYRSGRQARWRFSGKSFVSTKRWGMGGGISESGAMKRGETWSTELAMGSFIEPLLPGTHEATVLYDDEDPIANRSTVEGLICCRSKPFAVVVKPRAVRVTRDGRAEVVRELARLDANVSRKLVLGEFGPGNHELIPRDSSAGKIMRRGWEAVPVLIEALDDKALTPKRRAWVLALLSNITQALHPESMEDVYGAYVAESGWGPVKGTKNGELQDGMGWKRSRFSYDGEAKLEAQLEHAAKWKRFRKGLRIDAEGDD